MLLKHKDKKVDHEAIKATWSSVFEELTIQKSKWIVAYPLFFMLRRLALAATIIFFDKLIIQIYMMMAQIVVSLIIIGLI